MFRKLNYFLLYLYMLNYICSLSWELEYEIILVLFLCVVNIDKTKYLIVTSIKLRKVRVIIFHTKFLHLKDENS